MNIKEFEQKVLAAHTHENDKILECLFGLCEEVGEVHKIFKQHMRDNRPVDKEEICSELGDVLHYVTALGAYYGLALDDLMNHNINKIYVNKERYGIK